MKVLLYGEPITPGSGVWCYRETLAELGHDVVRELEELVLHGTLHLLGHDHERDEGEMDGSEMRLRDELLG